MSGSLLSIKCLSIRWRGRVVTSTVTSHRCFNTAAIVAIVDGSTRRRDGFETLKASILVKLSVFGIDVLHVLVFRPIHVMIQISGTKRIEEVRLVRKKDKAEK